ILRGGRDMMRTPCVIATTDLGRNASYEPQTQSQAWVKVRSSLLENTWRAAAANERFGLEFCSSVLCFCSEQVSAPSSLCLLLLVSLFKVQTFAAICSLSNR